MNTNTGGPAFPFFHEWTNEREGSKSTDANDGMSLRDYFAAKCIAGMLADPNVRDMDEFLKHAPRQAYAVADAMLKARDAE